MEESKYSISYIVRYRCTKNISFNLCFLSIAYVSIDVSGHVIVHNLCLVCQLLIQNNYTSIFDGGLKMNTSHYFLLKIEYPISIQQTVNLLHCQNLRCLLWIKHILGFHPLRNIQDDRDHKDRYDIAEKRIKLYGT